MTSPLTPLIPWFRQLARKYSAVDDADAFVSEAVIMAMRRMPHWDPERATLKTFLHRSVLSTYRDHARRTQQPWTSIHGLSCTELIEEWRTEPLAEECADVARNLQRDRWRMKKASAALTDRQRRVLSMRLSEAEPTLREVGAAIGSSKQAVGVTEATAKERLGRRRWQDCRGETKRKRVCLWLDESDAAAVGAAGVALSVFAASEGGLTVSGGTDVHVGVRAVTRMSLGDHARLAAAAEARGVSLSHLVRAKIRRELVHNPDREAV